MTPGRDAEYGSMFGDLVRVRTTPVTQAAGLAERIGTVHGWSTPSLGYVRDVIGDPIDDVAIAVHFGDDKPAVWLAPDLVELVDHQPGTTMSIAGQEFVRSADGGWDPVPPADNTRDGRP
jgi:hypothetical protein